MVSIHSSCQSFLHNTAVKTKTHVLFCFVYISTQLYNCKTKMYTAEVVKTKLKINVNVGWKLQ